MKMTQVSVNKVLSRFDSACRDIDSAIIGEYEWAGKYVTRKIRSGEMSDWRDVSGNLRSSVGYAVCKKGRIVKKSDFETVLNGSDGAAKGIKMIEELASEYSQYEYSLFIVAGEEYAVYVEAVDGKVVLASGQLYVEKNFVATLQRKIMEVLDKYEN